MPSTLVRSTSSVAPRAAERVKCVAHVGTASQSRAAALRARPGRAGPRARRPRRRASGGPAMGLGPHERARTAPPVGQRVRGDVRPRTRKAPVTSARLTRPPRPPRILRPAGIGPAAAGRRGQSAVQARHPAGMGQEVGRRPRPGAGGPRRRRSGRSRAPGARAGVGHRPQRAEGHARLPSGGARARAASCPGHGGRAPQAGRHFVVRPAVAGSVGPRFTQGPRRARGGGQQARVGHAKALAGCARRPRARRRSGRLHSGARGRGGAAEASMRPPGRGDRATGAARPPAAVPRRPPCR